MSSKRKKGKTIHAAAKEIICRVTDVCDEEANTGEIRFRLHQTQCRIADYTGVSERTVSRIKKECEMAGNSKLSTPGKLRPYRMSNIAHLDYFGIHVIRNTINDFYLFQKGELNSSKLLEAVKEKIDFPGSSHTLRKLLRDMGFKWKRCKNKKHRILVEHPKITMWRFKYLASVRKCREENKNIIYLTETWVDHTLNFKKCWYNANSLSTQVSIDRSNRVIILHACKETGFIENVQLIFEANERTEGYDGHMNYRTYEKWLIEKLLPNITQNSVIILDNSSYNSTEQNKMPSKYATKATMISWLEKNGVPVNPHMYKGELYNLLAKYKNCEKIYCIDEMLKAKGHTVLRLPPYMFILNPMELVWEKVESKIRKADYPQDIKMIVTEAMNSITVEDWEQFYSDVIKIENEYSSTDKAVEEEVDKFIVDLIDSESSDSSSEGEVEVEKALNDDF